MKKKNITLVAFILVLFIAGIAWVRTRPKPVQEYTGPVDTLTFVSPFGGTELNTLIFVASDMGYFKDQGVDVLVKDAPNSVAAEEEVSNGTADIAGIGDYTFVLNSFDQKDLKIITSVDKNSFLAIGVKKSAGLAAPADVRGKKIGIISKTILDFFLHQFLIDNGISDKEVTIVPVNSGGDLPEALVSSRVDVVAATLSQIYDIRKALKEEIVTLGDNKNIPFFWLLVMKGEAVSARPHVVERFLRALVLAENFVREHGGEAQAIIKKRFPDKGQDYFDLVWPTHSFKISLEQELLLNMENQAYFVLQHTLTDKREMPDYADYIYFDALNAVKPEGINMLR